MALGVADLANLPITASRRTRGLWCLPSLFMPEPTCWPPTLPVLINLIGPRSRPACMPSLPKPQAPPTDDDFRSGQHHHRRQLLRPIREYLNPRPCPPYLNMPASASDIIPPVLSQTGAFSDTSSLTPADGLIPYNDQRPALVGRSGQVPVDGCSFARHLRFAPEVTGPIGFSPSGSWSFPPGTVPVKNFEL